MALSVDLANLAGVTNANTGASGRGALGGSGGVAAQTKPSNLQGTNVWTVPEWQNNFDLITAKANAYAKAQQHMNTLLDNDNLTVELKVDDALGGENPREVTAQIKDKDTERLVTTYSGIDILRLFTHNTKPKGIVADGAI